METNLNTVLQVALIIGSAYLIFFKEYFGKKGKNLADKEDIAEIIKQIELVKKDFTRENEILKANLQYVINNQLQQSNEERNAIIFFFDNFSKWFNIGLLDTNINGYHINNIDSIYQKDRELNEYFTQTCVAQSRISLLVNNAVIVNLSQDLITETLKFNHWTQKILITLRFNLEDEKRECDLFMKYLNINPVPEDAKNIAQNQTILHQKKKVICDDYFNHKIEVMKNVVTTSTQFTEIVKVYLNKLKEN